MQPTITRPPVTTNPGSTRRRLWKAGGLLVAFVVSLLVGNFFLPAQRAVTRTMIGHDFLVFYTAGTFAREGQYHKLYDVDAVNAMESATGRAAGLAVGKTYGPWWNPPFAAWAFAPFSLLPFPRALAAWMAVSLLAFAASCVLLARMLGGGWRTWGLAPVLIFASGPFWGVVSHGQNTFISLFLLAATAALWRAGRAMAAGMVAGFLAYKPQLAAVVGVVLAVSQGRRALLGLMATGLVLLHVTVRTMPGALEEYVHALPRTLADAQELHRYFWDRHVTLKAFWRLLLQGSGPGPMTWTAKGLWWASEAAIGSMLGAAALAARRDPSRTDRLIACTIVATPLLMPFYFDYDLTLLAVPAVLCAADAMRTRLDRRVLWAWAATDAVLFVSTQLAGMTRVIPAAPLLAAITCLLAAKTVMVEPAAAVAALDEAPKAARKLAA